MYVCMDMFSFFGSFFLLTLKHTYIYKGYVFYMYMFKKHTTLNIDIEVLQKAKEKNFNLSEIAEQAIKDKLQIKEVEIKQDIKNCEFCGRETNLTWLYPDEKWTCDQCLRKKFVIV